MRARWAMAVASSCFVLASCSLVTTWDGLTSGEGAGAGGSGAGGSASDGGPDAPVDAATCTPMGLYCGGDKVEGDPNTLYRCNGDAAPSKVEVCEYGCVIRPPGEDDTCRCTPGGAYCGGDKVEGDPSTLYRCNQNGTGTVIEHCTKGCKVVPGQDDVCG